MKNQVLTVTQNHFLPLSSSHSDHQYNWMNSFSFRNRYQSPLILWPRTDVCHHYVVTICFSSLFPSAEMIKAYFCVSTPSLALSFSPFSLIHLRLFPLSDVIAHTQGSQFYSVSFRYKSNLLTNSFTLSITSPLYSLVLENSLITHFQRIMAYLERAYFGLQCFWGESAWAKLKGVVVTRVGYAGGKQPNPTYRNIKDHTEITEITFNPKVIEYSSLVDFFWKHHNPAERRKKVRIGVRSTFGKFSFSAIPVRYSLRER